MQTGTLMKKISVSNQSKRSFTMTAFTFDFTADLPIPANAMIVITYPTQITSNDTYLGCQLSNKNPDTACDFNT